jgi:putative membrane protein
MSMHGAYRYLRPAALITLLVPHCVAFAHTAHSGAGPGFAGLHWSLDPWVLIPLAVSGWLYVAGITRLWRESRTGGGIRRWQATCFCNGWLMLAVVLVSPLDPLGEELFSAHMVQHELLMLVAAPLMVLGRPLAVFVWALPAAWRRSTRNVTGLPAVAYSWRFVTHPLAAWIIHALVLWVWHAPPFFQASVVNTGVHILQHFSFLFAALLFWWSLLQARQKHGGDGAAILYLLTTAFHTSALGALLTFSSQVWYPVYAPTALAWGFTPLEDQQLGGLIMWVPGGLSYLFAALWLLARLLRASGTDGAGSHGAHSKTGSQ